MAKTQRKPLIVLVTAVTLLVAAACWILFIDPGGDASLLDSPNLRTEDAGRSEALPPEDGFLDEENAAGAGRAGEPDAAERVPVKPPAGIDYSIRGRVVMEGGAPPPRPLHISISPKKPPFMFFTIMELNRLESKCITTDKELLEVRSGALSLTDSSGRFIVEGSGAGKVHAVPFDTFLHAVRSPAVACPPDPEQDGGKPLVVVLAEGGAVEGMVHNSNGKPLSGVSLTLREKFDIMFALSDRKGMLASFTTQSRGDGTFRFNAVPCGAPMVIDAFVEGYARSYGQMVAIKKGQAVPVEVILADSAVISGLVQYENEEPVPGKKVRLSKTDDIINAMIQEESNGGFEVLSGPDGSFRFGDLAPGTYRVFLNERGFVRTGHKGLKLAAGEERSDLVLILEKGLSISGRIVSSDGEPVRDARVKPVPQFNLAKLLQYIDDAKYSRPSRTDEEGQFTCSGLTDGTYDLEISRNSITDTSQKGFKAGSKDLLISLHWGGIAGIAVSTVDGDPVRNYRLQLDPEGKGDLLDPFGFKSAIVRTIEDDEGRFDISPLEPGRFTMTVRAEGHGIKKIKNIEVADGEVTRGVLVMLSEEASVTGTVYDKETGEPIEGAKISLKPGLEGMIAEFRDAGEVVQSDEEGRFKFGCLPAGRVCLFVTHPSYESQILPEVLLMDGEKYENITVLLGRGAVIHGRVSTAAGFPVAGASLMASTPMATVLKSTRTDENGVYELAGFPAGTFTLMRMAMNFNMDDDFLQSLTSGFDMRYITLEMDEIVECDFVIDAEGKEARVRGRVTEAGNPVPGAIINVVPIDGNRSTPSSSTATTDDDGRYAITRIEAGEYTFRVVRTESLSMGGGTEVVFRTTIPDSSGHEFDMVLPGASIEGHVLDADSLKALSQVRIVLRRSEGSDTDDPVSQAMGGRIAEVYSDTEGRFRISNLREGTFDLSAGGANFLGINSGGYARKTVRDIDVHKDHAVRGIRVMVEKGGTIEGELRNRSGRPVSGAAVFFQPDREGRFETFAECYSDDSGKFVYTGLAAGGYTLAVKHSDYAIALVYDINVRKDKVKEIRLTMVDGTAVTVNVEDSSAGLPLSGALIDIADSAGHRLSELIGLEDIMKMFYAGGSGGPGVYYLGRYAPDTYLLTVGHPDHPPQSIEIQILPGETERIVTVSL